MKVTVVVPPAVTVTVAVPPAKLLLTNDPAGVVLTPVSTAPPGPGTVSVTVAVPACTTCAALQLPKGGAPAATLRLMGVVGGVVVMENANVPVPTPPPATLQTCRKPLLQAKAEITLLCSVTAWFNAKTLPVKTVAPVVKVTLADARIFPKNAVPVPIVAELPIWKNTLQGEPPLIMTTDELLAVVSVLPIWKMKTALGSP
jgi:hypothetical protein